jgi:hypothetical protein
MRHTARLAMLVTFTLVALTPLHAQSPAPSGLLGDIMKDVDDVQTKIVGLAKAMPETAYAWRPAKDVRSTGEVLMHVAADNYFMPAVIGNPAPAETGINGKEYKTAAAFEQKKMSRDQIIAEVEKSFAFVKTSLKSSNESNLEAPLEAFGQKMTARSMWLSTATHLHEHLGQLIAYARSNNVTPPWSK